eukprot:10810778-Lingulodinium_polyedra.AAC.1
MGAVSAFADDTIATRVVEDGEPSTALQMILEDDRVFNACVQQGGWRQNSTKKDLVVHLRRRGANRRLAALVKEQGGMGV